MVFNVIFVAVGLVALSNANPLGPRQFLPQNQQMTQEQLSSRNQMFPGQYLAQQADQSVPGHPLQQPGQMAPGPFGGQAFPGFPSLIGGQQITSGQNPAYQQGGQLISSEAQYPASIQGSSRYYPQADDIRINNKNGVNVNLVPLSISPAGEAGVAGEATDTEAGAQPMGGAGAVGTEAGAQPTAKAGAANTEAGAQPTEGGAATGTEVGSQPTAETGAAAGAAGAQPTAEAGAADTMADAQPSEQAADGSAGVATESAIAA